MERRPHPRARPGEWASPHPPTPVRANPCAALRLHAGQRGPSWPYVLWLWLTVMFELLFTTFAAFPLLILLFEIE
jgi:hypothetical protein